MSPRLELNGITARYDAGGPATLEQINVAVSPGEVVMLLGPSGCGKSTLLNIVAGLIKPETGSVLVDGSQVTAPGPDRTVVFQDGALFPWLTVRGNVEFGLREAGVGGAQRKVLAEESLAKMGLAGWDDRAIHELSGGMRQRVAIARALVLKPKVLLMDEPFSALDAMTREDLYSLLQGVEKDLQTTIVFVTHNVREAVTLGDRVLVMAAKPGRIVAEYKVDIPRPRQIDNAEVSALARQISTEMRGEA